MKEASWGNSVSGFCCQGSSSFSLSAGLCKTSLQPSQALEDVGETLEQSRGYLTAWGSGRVRIKRRRLESAVESRRVDLQKLNFDLKRNITFISLNLISCSRMFSLIFCIVVVIYHAVTRRCSVFCFRRR